jgi:hypothetical protein
MKYIHKKTLFIISIFLFIISILHFFISKHINNDQINKDTIDNIINENISTIPKKDIIKNILSNKLLIFSFIFWLIISLLDLYVIEHIDYLLVNKSPLPDILHKNIPMWPKTENIPTIIIFIILLYSIIRFTYININIISLLFFALGILIAIRIIIYSVTQTPSAMPRKFNHCKKHLLNYFGISFFKEKNSCIDNMFSGHTIHLMIPLFLLLIFSKNLYEKIIVGIISIIICFLIITSRMHYTSNVLISIYMSFSIIYICKCVFENLNIKI